MSNYHASRQELYGRARAALHKQLLGQERSRIKVEWRALENGNNTLIAWLTCGEGWHNNHHADPRSARHGHMRGEFDFTWIVIKCLMALGLARNVALPSALLAEKFKGSTALHSPEKFEAVEADVAHLMHPAPRR